MKTNLSDISKFLNDNDGYSIVAHKGPDGDSLGSISALGLTLQQMGKRVSIYCTDPIPNQFKFLPFLNNVIFDRPNNFDDVLLVLDCSDEKRLSEQNIHYDKFNSIVNIDHHPFNTEFGDVNFCDSSKIATCELVYELIKELNVDISTEVAEALYLGIITDSGNFGFDNTKPETHQIVADLLSIGVSPNKFKTNLEKKPLNYLKFLGKAFEGIKQAKDGKISYLFLKEGDIKSFGLKDYSETDSMIDYLRNIEGTQVAVLVKEDNDLYKFSLRSNSNFDVGELCRHYGGGGHKKAAGFSTNNDPQKIMEEIIKIIN